MILTNAGSISTRIEWACKFVYGVRTSLEVLQKL
jgi:hypothetical protein